MPPAGSPPHVPPPPTPTWRHWFFAGYVWLILKNVIGWALILSALVAGPLVPGPGGIPLFLIGFAMISFPGKRQLTARVLRGRRVPLRRRAVVLAAAGASLAAPALLLWLLGSSPGLGALNQRGWVTLAGAYLLGVLIAGLAAYGAMLTLNLSLRVMPRIRRRARPWLRRHRIRLLPPRRRTRLAHERGVGPLRLKDDILSFLKRPRRADQTGPTGHAGAAGAPDDAPRLTPPGREGGDVPPSSASCSTPLRDTP